MPVSSLVWQAHPQERTRACDGEQEGQETDGGSYAQLNVSHQGSSNERLKA